MKQNQVRRYRHERVDCAKYTKIRRGEGRKFVKVSFKPEKKRVDEWTLRAEKKRPDKWIKGTRKTGKTDGRKRQAGADFLSERRKRDEMEKISKKIEKKFKKGVAISRKIEYNVTDVCKGDEVTDCSLAGEGTVMDHVRQSDDGSRSVMQGKSQASRT